MAAPKPKPPAADPWGLPPEDRPLEFDERRFEEILEQPGVVVHQRNPELAHQQFKPISVVEGSMTVEDLLRLLGRRDPEGDWMDWSEEEEHDS